MMDYRLTEEQEALRNDVRAYLAEKAPLSAVRALHAAPQRFDLAMYRDMGQRGWLGIGDSSDAWTRAVLVHQEFGRALTPGPMYASAAVSAALLNLAGRSAGLAGLVHSGQRIAAAALVDDEGTGPADPVHLVDSPAGRILTGRKALVDYAEAADVYVVLADTSGGQALAVLERGTPGIGITTYDSLGGKPRSLLTFQNVLVDFDRVLPVDGGRLNQHLRDLRLLTAAELLGVAEVALDLAVDYARNRVQYGRPIGVFQAIQHKAANMLIQIDRATWLIYHAAWQLDRNDDAGAAVSMALLRAGQAARFVTSEAVQIHGGVGVMDRTDISLYYRRAKAGELELGNRDDLRERIIESL